jgi:hypothetical protein
MPNPTITATDEEAAGRTALDRLREREEVLEICFWYQGEGLGSVFTPALVLPFLNTATSALAETFEALVADGSLLREGNGYALTPSGKRQAGRTFTETFVEFQQPGHGECQDGCCDGDENCVHNGSATVATMSFGAGCGFEHRIGEPCNHSAFFRMRYQRP